MKELQRVAIIDMGTNTFHLLVAEAGEHSKILYRDRAAVKIGQGGINSGVITPDAAQRAMKTLGNFKAVIEKLGAQKVLAFGTSAVRNASNGRQFVEEIRRLTGIETRIINGDEEASLIYEGVRHAIELGEETSLIVDIGGGSVEFILANSKKIFWKGSFEVGGQRLLERFHRHDPILPSEIDELMTYINKELASLFEQLSIHEPRVLVGVSGTFDTLSEIYCGLKTLPYRPDDPETPLTLESFYSTFELLIRKNRAERLAIKGMIEMRVDMIVVACCLLKLLTDKHQFSRIRVSTWSLKEGALMKWIS